MRSLTFVVAMYSMISNLPGFENWTFGGRSHCVCVGSKTILRPFFGQAHVQRRCWCVVGIGEDEFNRSQAASNGLVKYLYIHIRSGVSRPHIMNDATPTVPYLPLNEPFFSFFSQSISNNCLQDVYNRRCCCHCYYYYYIFFLEHHIFEKNEKNWRIRASVILEFIFSTLQIKIPCQAFDESMTILYIKTSFKTRN